MKKFYSILIFSLLFFLPAGKSAAFEILQTEDRTENRFIVHPGKIEMSAVAGDKKEFRIIVANRLGREVNFFVKEENEDKYLTEQKSLGWVTPELTNFSLKNGERITFTIKISLPPELPGGGYYPSLIIGTQGEKNDTSKDSVKLVSQVKIPILAKVSGVELNENLDISFRPKYRFFLQGPVDFETKIKNIGNIHAKAEGEIGVVNILNFKTAQITLASKIIFPGEEEKMDSRWNKKFPIGIYKAKADLRFGEKNNFVKEKYFVVFPLHILALIIFLGWLVCKMYKKVKGKYSWKISWKKEKKDD